MKLFLIVIIKNLPIIRGVILCYGWWHPIEELDVPISLYLGSSVKRVYFSCSICSQQIATVKSQKGSLNK